MSKPAHKKFKHKFVMAWRQDIARSHEAFEAKRALLQMYDESGIHDTYTQELRERVRRLRISLINKGELTP